jgi:hypothetical protein
MRTALFTLAAALFLSVPAYADLLLSPPGDYESYIFPPSAADEAGYVEDAFGLTSGSLDLLYKADVGDVNDPTTEEDGSFQSSYDTVFANTALDPSGATISFVGGSAISCPECYLVVKDGNNNPNFYFYDISAWDGTEAIILTEFWPGRGAISYVAIYGADGVTVPEPSTMLLLGTGGFAMVVGGRYRRRKKEVV